MIKVLKLSVLVLVLSNAGLLYAEEGVVEWAEKVKVSEAASERASAIEEKSDLILKVNSEGLCKNAPQKYIDLLELQDSYEDFYREYSEILIGPTSQYKYGEGPCAHTWYYGNPALASYDVIHSIYNSGLIEPENKTMCLGKWKDFLEVWGAYKTKITNNVWDLRECSELSSVDDITYQSRNLMFARSLMESEEVEERKLERKEEIKKDCALLSQKISSLPGTEAFSRIKLRLTDEISKSCN